MALAPRIPRLMAFIDGENLVARYQSMLRNGRVPQPEVRHSPDEFVWHSGFGLGGYYEVVRAHYYTSIVGDDDKVAEVVARIRGIRFCAGEISPAEASLYAKVYKKPSKSQKVTTIDIQLAVDMLSHAYQGNLDAVALLTGDGDFESLAREVVARGKRPIIGALSDGLSPVLRPISDRFIDLDPLFLQAPAAA